MNSSESVRQAMSRFRDACDAAGKDRDETLIYILTVYCDAADAVQQAETEAKQ